MHQRSRALIFVRTAEGGVSSNDAQNKIVLMGLIGGATNTKVTPESATRQCAVLRFLILNPRRLGDVGFTLGMTREYMIVCRHKESPRQRGEYDRD